MNLLQKAFKYLRHPELLRVKDFSEIEQRVLTSVKPFTMTSIERRAALMRALQYVCRNGIPGAVVECGVWKGGSMMLAAETLYLEGQVRPIHLYDTFNGMTPPTEKDVAFNGLRATDHADFIKKQCTASFCEVQRNMARCHYPASWIHYHAGDVLRTLNGGGEPFKIALLRLDTDWYESTIHELRSLWYRVAPGGFVILDDYGHWLGSRKAADEFFVGGEYLHRIDHSGVIVQKVR